jgi:hypothetical protein
VIVGQCFGFVGQCCIPGFDDHRRGNWEAHHTFYPVCFTVGTMSLGAMDRRTVSVVKFGAGINELSGRAPMTSQLELDLRAALCRQLAKREPANRAIWVAEAKNWLRPSKEKLRGEAEQKLVPA